MQKKLLINIVTVSILLNMINIYTPTKDEVTPVLKKTRSHIMPFEFELDSFRFVYSPVDADVIPVVPHASAEEFESIIIDLNNNGKA